MKDWNSLYKERGIIQKKTSGKVIEAVNYFKQEDLKRVLDLGCGTGRHTAYLLKEGFQVYGCDSSAAALEIAKRISPEVKFEKCVMTSLPYEDGSFDGIICNNVIQHGKIADIKRAISEIHRILRKRGILFLVAISTKHPKYLTGIEIEPNTKVGTDSIDGYTPHHFFTGKEMRELFKNFEIIKLEHFDALSEIDQDRRMAAWKMYARRPD